MEKSMNELDSELMIKLNVFLSEKSVIQATSLSRASLHRKRLAGEFPEPEEISDGRVGYRIRDIKAWLDNPKGWVNPGDSLDI